MKVLGLNSFTAKNGDHWLVASGVQKFSYPEGKKGYENCEHWFRNPDQNIIERMGGRRACVSCGATYHIVNIPPKKEGICDVCGAELILRDDDKPETVAKRLDVYHEQTQPLIDYYQAEGVLKDVDGTVDMMDVFESIVQVLGA